MDKGLMISGGGGGVRVNGADTRDIARSQHLKRVVAALNARLHKSKTGLLNETFDPLWNMSALRAQLIYNQARSGNYAQLQYLYNEIENCNPTFNVCITRRCSALAELGWSVVRSDERLNRDADKGLVKEQTEFLETAMAKIDNIPEALDHMALAAFRGYSILNIWRDASEMPTHLECLDSWNICRDREAGVWLWNPSGSGWMTPSKRQKGLYEIPKEDMVAVVRKREIDWPGIQIFLRNAVGERDWGRFMETYGLPPVILTMPESTSKEDEPAFVEAAAEVFEGRTGVVPFGTNVSYGSESRGVNPFTDFIDHQMKLFVLMATGGTLTSLAESGSGTLAGEAQMDVWRQIVRADVRIVSNAFNKQLCIPLLKAHKDFKNKPALVEFKLDNEPQLTAKEVLELASAASSAGFEMDAEELSRATGFTIRKKVEGGMGFNAQTPGMDGEDRGKGGGVALISDKAAGAEVMPVVTARKPDESGKPAENAQTSGPLAQPLAPNAGDGPTVGAGADGKGAETARVAPGSAGGTGSLVDEGTPVEKISRQELDVGKELVRSLQEDFKPVADELAKVLSKPEAERAGAAVELLSKLDKLVPDDPAMAEIIEEQMREAFKQQLKKQPEGDAPAANKAIPN